MAPGSAPVQEIVGVPVRTSARRTRIGAAAFVAVLAIAAVVLGVHGSGPGHEAGRRSTTTPPTHSAATEPTLTGPGPRVPYLVGQGLYVDGRSVPGRWDGLSVAGRSAVGYRSVPDQDGAEMVIRDGRIVLTFASVPWSPAVLSPDGNLVAGVVVNPSRTEGHLVLHDLLHGREVGRLPVDPFLLTVDDDRAEHVVRVDDDGTVTYGGLSAWHTWHPGSAPVDMAVPEDGTLYRGFPRYADPVWLSPRESWGAWLTRRNGANPAPDTDRPGLLEAVTVQRPGRPETRFTIEVPGANPSWLSWESASDLLVTLNDPDLNSPAHYLRCSIVSRTCERAPTVLER